MHDPTAMNVPLSQENRKHGSRSQKTRRDNVSKAISMQRTKSLISSRHRQPLSSPLKRMQRINKKTESSRSAKVSLRGKSLEFPEYSKERLYQEIFKSAKPLFYPGRLKQEMPASFFLYKVCLRASSRLKRLLDILVSAIAIICLAPVFVGISVLVRLESTGTIFENERVLGRDGMLFQFYQFRIYKALRPQCNFLQIFMKPMSSKKWRPRLSKDGEKELTTVGKWLKYWDLYRLPCLFNVLIGDMSFFGPSLLSENDMRYALLNRRNQLHLSPGLTSLGVPQKVLNEDWESVEHEMAQRINNTNGVENFKFLAQSIIFILLGWKIY